MWNTFVHGRLCTPGYITVCSCWLYILKLWHLCSILLFHEFFQGSKVLSSYALNLSICNNTHITDSRGQRTALKLTGANLPVRCHVTWVIISIHQFSVICSIASHYCLSRNFQYHRNFKPNYIALPHIFDITLLFSGRRYTNISRTVLLHRRVWAMLNQNVSIATAEYVNKRAKCLKAARIWHTRVKPKLKHAVDMCGGSQFIPQRRYYSVGAY